MILKKVSFTMNFYFKKWLIIGNFQKGIRKPVTSLTEPAGPLLDSPRLEHATYIDYAAMFVIKKKESIHNIYLRQRL